MKLHGNILFHIFIALVFSTCFLFYLHFMNDYIDNTNLEKSTYPILVYTDTLNEADDILDYVKDNNAFLNFELTNPQMLSLLLVEKYGLEEFNNIISDIILPYLLEIYLKPDKPVVLEDIIKDLEAFFPNSITQYNDTVWDEIETNVQRLIYLSWAINALLLITYLAAQLYFRMIYFARNAETIKAILNSGISHKKLKNMKAKENFVFLFYSIIITLAIDYAYSAYFIFEELGFNLLFFNLEYITMMVAVNLLFVILKFRLSPRV